VLPEGAGAEGFSSNGWVVLPVPAAESVEGLDADLLPVLRREAVGLPNKEPARKPIHYPEHES
jgi:hypothetical protein